MTTPAAYPAFPAYPAAGPLTGPVRRLDTSVVTALKVMLTGTAFSAQVQVSNATAPFTTPDHLFSPAESDWENIGAVMTQADPPLDIQGPVQWVRVKLLSGTVMGGSIAESQNRGETGKNAADVRQTAQGVVTLNAGSVDVKKFSVAANGTDQTANLLNAIASGEHLTITAPGDYLIDNGAQGPLNLYNFTRSLTMLPGTRLLIRDNTKQGLWFHAPTGIELSLNVEYQTHATVRAENMHAIQLDDPFDVVIRRLRSVGSPAMGAMIYRGTRVSVVSAYVEATMADGLHFYNPYDCHAGIVRTYNTGDDGLAIHGKPADGPSPGIGLTVDSVIARNAAASGIASIGASEVLIEQFIIENTGVSGVRLGSDTNPDPFGLGRSSRLTLGRGRIIGAGRNAVSVTPGAAAHGIAIGNVDESVRIGQLDILNSKTHGVYAIDSAYLALGEVTVDSAGGGESFRFERIGHVDHQGTLTSKNAPGAAYHALNCTLFTGQAPQIVNAASGGGASVLVDGGTLNWTTPLGITDTRNPSPGRNVTFANATGQVAGVQGQFVAGGLILSTGAVRVGHTSGLTAAVLSKPTFPTNGTVVTNTTQDNVLVYVFNGSDATKNVTGLFLNGAHAGTQAGTVRLKPGDTISISYAGVSDPDATGPGWLWQPI